MQNKINVGIIGKNFGYNVIYKTLSKNKIYRVVGFSYKSKNEKIKLPKKIKLYSNWKNLVSDKKIKAVIIAAPPFLHNEIIKFAIKKNKHIFCEKPLTCKYKDVSLICSLIKEKKNISHMVNYEFTNISAFKHLRKKINKCTTINKVNLNWFINLSNRSNKNWKENHARGGGIMFNYICHSIFYLEFLFGKIISVKTKIFLNSKRKIKSAVGFIFFKKNIIAKINVQVGKLDNKYKPIHQINVITNQKKYVLETKLNTLSDKFNLFVFEKNTAKKNSKSLQSIKNRDDFRIMPTAKNLQKFSEWILKNKVQTPNFFDAKRIHLIIQKMINSSKTEKKIYIN